MPPLRELSGVRAVCFDAGNVLKRVDRERVSQILTANRLLHHLDRWDVAELFARDAVNRLAAAPGSLDRDHAMAYWQALLAGIGLPSQEVSAARQAIFAESRRSNIWKCAVPGAVEVLDELHRRGYSLAVISNADGRCEDDLVSLGVGQRLDFIIDSRLVGVEKPDPAIFHQAARQLGIAASQVCFVGDIYHIDVVGARNAGMIPVLIEPRARTHFGDCIVIRSLQELPALLPAIPAVATQ